MSRAKSGWLLLLFVVLLAACAERKKKPKKDPDTRPDPTIVAESGKPPLTATTPPTLPPAETTPTPPPASPPPSGAPAPGQQVKFTFPDVAGWRRSGPKFLEGNAGYSYAYNADGMTVTVFVYDNGPSSPIPNGHASEVVRSEVESGVSTLQSMAKSGNTYRSVTVAKRDVITLGSDPSSPQAQRAILRSEFLDGKKVVSTIVITGAKGSFVKLRVTQPPELAEDPRLLSLYSAVGRTISAP